jgi:hypothetical protein
MFSNTYSAGEWKEEVPVLCGSRRQHWNRGKEREHVFSPVE